MIGPAHDVDAGALRGQGEDGKGIGVLAADQCADRPELGLERTERVAESSHMHEPLADGRHDLLMLADQRAVGREIDLRVEHGAQRVGHLLAHPDHHIRVGFPRRARELLGLWSGDFHRILEQLDGEPVGERARCGMVVIPDGMRGNEAFRKSDYARAVAAGFPDQRASLGCRAFAVEEHGGGLHRGDF